MTYRTLDSHLQMSNFLMHARNHNTDVHKCTGRKKSNWNFDLGNTAIQKPQKRKPLFFFARSINVKFTNVRINFWI